MPANGAKLAAIALGLLVSSACARAQVIEVGGGTSTLFQSQGGAISFRGRGYDASAGAGMINGKFYPGAQFVKRLERSTIIAGTDNVTFDLPTDIFQGGHYLTVVGLGLRSKLSNADVYSFVGETSTSFNSPFFNGTKAEKPAVILFASGKVAAQWTAATRVIVPDSFRATVIHSFAYDSDDGKKFAVAGGLGSGHLYFASSLSLEQPRYDLKAAYIESSTQFRRANVSVPVAAEPDRENIQFTVRPTKWMSLTAARQNYLTPIYQTSDSIRSSVNQASANFMLAGTNLSVSEFQSKYNGGENLASAYTASRNFGSRLFVQTAYLVSKPKGSSTTSTIVGNVQENLTPRWSISQMVSSSDGQTTYGGGASFLSNIATLSANYQTFYVPSRINSPWEEALIINAQIHLLGRLTLGGGTFVAPDGSLLYTAEGRGMILRDAGDATPAAVRNAVGNMVIHGRVVDTEGKPIMGAALLVDQLAVYTDSQGNFYVRERKPHTHPFTVLADQFLDGGVYKVVTAPAEVKSGTDQPEQLVVVERAVVVARR